MPKLLFILFSCVSLQVFAQNDRNNWFFGEKAAMNFDKGVMNISNNNPNSSAHKGYDASSISDPITGELLFYELRGSVYDRSHHVMRNWTPITNTFDLVDLVIVGILKLK